MSTFCEPCNRPYGPCSSCYTVHAGLCTIECTFKKGKYHKGPCGDHICAICARCVKENHRCPFLICGNCGLRGHSTEDCRKRLCTICNKVVMHHWTECNQARCPRASCIRHNRHSELNHCSDCGFFYDTDEYCETPREKEMAYRNAVREHAEECSVRAERLIQAGHVTYCKACVDSGVKPSDCLHSMIWCAKFCPSCLLHGNVYPLDSDCQHCTWKEKEEVNEERDAQFYGGR